MSTIKIPEIKIYMCTYTSMIYQKIFFAKKQKKLEKIRKKIFQKTENLTSKKKNRTLKFNNKNI